MPHPLELLLVPPVQATPRPHQPLQLGRRARACELEQIALTLGSGHTRERPHLGERQLALGHGRADLGKLGEGSSSSHPLTGGTQVDPGTEGEPVGAGAVSARLPPPELVELGDQCEEAVLGGMDVCRERGDLVAQVLESVQLVVDCPIDGGRVSGLSRVGRFRRPFVGLGSSV